MTRTQNPWLICNKPNPQAQLRLFCFPYAGGGASIYRMWPQALPSFVEVYAVQLPGRENRLKEAPFMQLTPMVEALATALMPHLQTPFAFFGHSMGAMICFDLARLLRSKYGLRPVHLFISGRHAPQLPDTRPICYDLPEPEFIDQLRRFKGTPEEVLQHTELLELLIPILRADFSVVETYQYEASEPLDCPITALGGLEDEEASRDEIDAWRTQTTSAFALRMFPGGHFFLNLAQVREQVLQTIAQDLNRIALPGVRAAR